MDIYQAILAENRLLEKAIRKLVDSTASEPLLRQELLDEIKTRFEVLESIKQNNFYPHLRFTFKREDIAEEYERRVNAIRQSIWQLEEMPPDETTDYQYTAETLHKQLTDLSHWETQQIFPDLRKIIDDETAVEIGEHIRSQVKESYHQE